MILEIQHGMKHHEGFMLLMSHFGNPKNAFLLYFPLAWCLRQPTGVKVLWIASISEWLNGILKWFLHGERPYWWIHENKWYQERDRSAVLDQFHLTCETGPGSPSGHAMVTAAVLFVLFKDLIEPLMYKGLKSRCVSNIVSWLVFAVILLLVCVSRCFIAAHFPHQVVSGTFIGILLAHMSYRVNLDSVSFGMYSLTSAVLMSFAIFTYFVVKFFGVDPMWSLDLAQKWCLKKDWIHLDTTLFAGIIRDASCILGLGLGLALVPKSIEDDMQRPWTLRLLSLVLCLGLLQASQYCSLPEDRPLLFYVLLAVMYVVMIMLVVCIPNVVNFLNRNNEEGQKVL